MFELSEAEAGILEAIAINDSFDDKGKPKGLTFYQIKEYGRIPPGNWYKHRDLLLYYQLISKIFEKKKKPKRIGKKRITPIKKIQIRYSITSLGFIVLLKWLKPKDINKKFKDVLKIFVPHIAIHWKELEDLFGNALVVILRDSINQIQLTPISFHSPKRGDEYSNIVGKQIEEKIELKFELEQISFSVFNILTTISPQEKKILEQKNYLKFFPNYDELINDVTRRFTFIFYFNLILLHYDPVYALKVYRKVHDPNFKTVFYQVKKQKKESKFDLIDQPISKVKNEVEEVLSKSSKLSKLSKKVMNIVENDNDLYQLFKDNLREFSSKIKNIQTMKSMIKKF